MKILIVDDEVNLLQSLGDVLRSKGFMVGTARNGLEALDRLKERFFDLIIADLKMPRMGGMELLEVLRERYPQTTVVILTGYGTVKSAVDAIKRGAYDYLVKPFVPDEILLIIQKVVEEEILREEHRYMRQELERRGEIITENPEMRKLKDLTNQVARSNATVLITGETGTGKELIARAIHHQSLRKAKLFVKLNCAALAEGVLESELFGHERGAFTDAYHQKRGRFEVADGGTLFLDEIGDISPAIQVKLLRVLQEGEFERVGGEETIRVDVRIIAATNQNLSEAIKEKRFREDLFYRLNVVSFYVPPLRKRKEDIPLLARHFLKKYRTSRRQIEDISEAALDYLTSYDWPGNVRELENAIERAVVLAKDSFVKAEDLALSTHGLAKDKGISLPSKSLWEVESYLIKSVLEETDWNLKKTARILQISRTTLYSKINKHKI
ncbi:sigma-54-dependent Fis family transcriptional regulator, partial [Candidatus Aerophobetes bacterium]